MWKCTNIFVMFLTLNKSTWSSKKYFNGHLIFLCHSLKSPQLNTSKQNENDFGLSQIHKSVDPISSFENMMLENVKIPFRLVRKLSHENILENIFYKKFIFHSPQNKKIVCIQSCLKVDFNKLKCDTQIGSVAFFMGSLFLWII